MRVLVTGHLGYIGVELVSVLLASGHEVVGLDTGLFNECDFVSPPDPIETLDVDLRDVKPDDVRGFDAVAHLGALSNDPLGDINPQLTYDINLHASVRLAEAAKAAGVGRFLFSSSCSLYGAGGDLELDETRRLLSGHGVRRVEGARRAAGVNARRRTVLAGLPPQCNGVRRLADGSGPTSSSTTSSATR